MSIHIGVHTSDTSIFVLHNYVVWRINTLAGRKISSYWYGEDEDDQLFVELLAADGNWFERYRFGYEKFAQKNSLTIG